MMKLVMGLVEKALEKPSSNREAYLRETCGNNSELVERVWHYIEREERMHGFLLDPLPRIHGSLLSGMARHRRSYAFLAISLKSL
jgi:hypothetical protein